MNTIPTHVQILLDELTFISLTKQNEKICFTTRTTVDGSSTYGYLYRRWYGEGENTLISNLRSITGMVEEALSTESWKPFRIQILTKTIEFHGVLVNQIKLYDYYHSTKAALIGLRDRISTILLNISPEDNELIKQRQTLQESRFSVNIIGGTPPDPSPLNGILPPGLSPHVLG